MARLTPDLLCLGVVKSAPCAECGFVCSAVSDRALAQAIMDHFQRDLVDLVIDAMGFPSPRSDR